MSKVKSKAVWLGFILLLSAFTNYPVAAVPEIKDTNIIIIYAGTLLEVPGQTVKTRQTVVIENKNIQSIHDGYLSAQALQLKPTQIKIIDLKNLFVLPGLIDAHVHLLNRSDQKFRQLHISDEEKLIYGVVNARLTLDAGFTTVADLDAVGHSWPLLVLRNAINAGNIPGPRVFAAGDSISSTGGHGDFLDNRDELLSNHNSPGLCDGPDECRRAVRRQFRQGADLIKIMASGGGGERTGGKHHAPSFTADELKAIVETAHSLDMKVTAHAHGTAGINAALSAGVDSIEHASFLDKQSVSLFKKTGAYLIATLSTQDMIKARVKSAPEKMKTRLNLYINEHPANIKMAYDRGVKLALGSDAGAVPHGNNVREIEWLVQIGISESEAIKIATTQTAGHLGISEYVGRLIPGMTADLIAVEGDPLKNISALRQIRFVMKEGLTHKNSTR